MSGPIQYPTSKRTFNMHNLVVFQLLFLTPVPLSKDQRQVKFSQMKKKIKKIIIFRSHN